MLRRPSLIAVIAAVSFVAGATLIARSATSAPASATPSPPVQYASSYAVLAQCVSGIGPPPPAVARTSPPHSMSATNLCNETINLAACYVDGSSCWEYGVPPMRQEQLAQIDVIKGHGGIHFYPCEAGYDAVDAKGQRLSRYLPNYRCLAERSTDTSPPCAVPDGPAMIVFSALPVYPSEAGDAGNVEVSIVVSLDSDGSLLSMRVQQSSGNMFIDRDASRVVRQSIFSPKIEHCTGVQSQYSYLIDYRYYSY